MGNGCRERHDRRQQIQRDPDARIPPSKGTRCPSSQSASRLFDPSTGDRDRSDVDGLASKVPLAGLGGLCICGLGLKCAQSRLSPGATWLEIDSMGFSLCRNYRVQTFGWHEVDHFEIRSSQDTETSRIPMLWMVPTADGEPVHLQVVSVNALTRCSLFSTSTTAAAERSLPFLGAMNGIYRSTNQSCVFAPTHPKAPLA